MAEFRVLQGHDLAPLGHLGVADGLRGGAHRRGLAPLPVQSAQSGLEGLLRGPPCDEAVQTLGVGHAGVPGSEVLGLEEVGAADRPEHARGELIGGRTDGEPPVDGFERAEGREPGT